ncbi:MAG: aminoacyl--tRNA ligase-related protein [Candidatus Bathyarchaeota archaeon]
MIEEMIIQLTCIFTMSKNIEDTHEEIVQIIEKANKELFAVGFPKGKSKLVTKIIHWDIRAEAFTFTITSGKYARAPSAVLRFRKLLAGELGSKYKIGIREVEVLSFEVKLPLEKSSTQLMDKIKALTYVQDVTFGSGELNVHFRPMKEGELKNNVPDRALALVEETIEKAGSSPSKVSVDKMTANVVRKGSVKSIRFQGEPSKIGVELGWIKEFPGRGQWVYTTPYVKLLEIIEDIIINEIIRKFDFQPFMLPKLIPLEVMRKMPGYLENIPEGMYYVCHPPRDPEAFSKFKETMKVTKSIPKKMLKEIISEPEYVLAPAQCEPFWQFFSHETVRAETLPIKLYDRAGWTYRWEGGGVEALTRIQEFRRIELGYLGTPEQVIYIRDAVRDKVVEIVDKTLDLEWRIVGAAPFYMKDVEIGDITESKNVSAYDVEVYLPYRGERESAEWLEIAACFIHKNKFVESFSVHEARGLPMWTGCCGLGTSRWVAAFLATHGFKPENWPKIVKEKFGTYKLPNTLLWPKNREET